MIDRLESDGPAPIHLFPFFEGYTLFGMSAESM
jgi:hypothetical protein